MEKVNNEQFLLNIFKYLLNRQPSREELEYHKSHIDSKHKTREQKKQEFLESEEFFNRLREDSNPKFDVLMKTQEQPLTHSVKTAVCISGHLRNYKKTFPTILENLIKRFKADLFIHTWDDMGFQEEVSPRTVGPKPKHDGSKISEKELVEYFSPKSYILENNSKFLNNFEQGEEDFFLYAVGHGSEEVGFLGSAEPKYVMSQLFSIYQSNELKKEYEMKMGFEYDLVIKIRMDYSLSNSIPLEDITYLLNNLEKKVIYVPNHECSNHGHPSCYLCVDGEHSGDHVCDVCDVFAYGSSKNMNHYASLYENCIKLYDNMRKQNQELISTMGLRLPKYGKFYLVPIWLNSLYHKINCFYPERLFRAHLREFRILPSSLNGRIIR